MALRFFRKLWRLAEIFINPLQLHLSQRVNMKIKLMSLLIAAAFAATSAFAVDTPVATKHAPTAAGTTATASTGKPAKSKKAKAPKKYKKTKKSDKASATSFN
jgi:hypothetical protein